MEAISRIKPRSYYDSITLLRVSQTLAALPGIAQASVVMATEANKALLADAGLLTADAAAAAATDLVIAVLAAPDVAASALVQVEAALRGGGPAGGAQMGAAPRTLRAALRERPSANLALISVPGTFAVHAAMDALRAGLHVMLFSDNVPLADERTLKVYARDHALLCMGPDCGTALLDGVGLGFSNAVRRGDVGIVAAAGTGAQEVSVLVDRFGGGISQMIGTGGRDLHADIGGLMMLSGIAWLAADPATSTIVIISKPPDPAVAAAVLGALQGSGKRCIVCFLGYTGPALPGIELAPTLRAAAALAAGVAEPPAPALPALPAVARGGRLRGLFAGGTLCAEARLVLAERGLAARADLVDYGDDEFTLGRPHPMIDDTLRLAALQTAAADPATVVLLLDVVLGSATQPDPAARLAPLIATIAQPVVVYVCGTVADGRAAQVAALAAAGALIADLNAAAAELAAALLEAEQ